MTKIVTQHVCPPIPIRSHDWCAYHDGCEEGPVGWGPTEEAALLSLAMLTEEEDTL